MMGLKGSKKVETLEDVKVILKELIPKGVAVVLEMEHLCMSMRGVMSPGHLTVTSALRGLSSATSGQGRSLLR